ncbi:hypothetical protein [Mucilaginibacter sp.]|uniref:hypothetical protein n=1 Tax=Mucilaginibacter sp. TaxID=1882438 RepID=UPI0035BBAE4F
MIIKNIVAQLEAAIRPVSKIVKTGDSFKSLAIGLKKGMVWRDHKAAMPTRLLVIKGHVAYRQDDQLTELDLFSDMDIPVDIIHSLEAREDSICVLIQG